MLEQKRVIYVHLRNDRPKKFFKRGGKERWYHWALTMVVDNELVEWLRPMKNVSHYIRELIRKDMKPDSDYLKYLVKQLDAKSDDYKNRYEFERKMLLDKLATVEKEEQETIHKRIDKVRLE